MKASAVLMEVLKSAGVRYLFDEPILSGDLVQMTEQYTKWSYERDVLQTCLAHEGPSLVDVAIDRGFKAMT